MKRSGYFYFGNGGIGMLELNLVLFKIYLKMGIRRLAIFCFLLPACGALLAQAELQPREAYPFRVDLFTTDSARVSSREIFSKGVPTVVSFWLTTCVPCLNEFEAYASAYAEWRSKASFALVGISLDFPARFKQIGSMSKVRKWPFPVYWDKDRVFKELMPGGLNGMPQVFLFDKNGLLVWHHKGFAPGAEQALWRQILALQ